MLGQEDILSRCNIYQDRLGPTMISYLATLLLVSSTLFSFAASPLPEKAVTLKGEIKADAAQADHFTVTVEMDINEGWHTYDDVGEGSEVRTTLQLELPEGVTAKGDWSRPSGVDGKETNSLVFEGLVSFSRDVIIEPNAYGKSIDVVVSYQACTDEYCNRPKSETVSIAIPKESASSSSIFDRPVRISVEGKPLNAVEQKKFPSPAIFDIDADGKAELVMGDLWGDVGVHENLAASGAGDPVWGPRKALKDSDGKAIRTSNW